MANYEDKLKELSKRSQDAQSSMIRCETKIESLNQRRTELLLECDKKGVDPDGIDQAIATDKEKLDDLIVQIDSFLPSEELIEDDNNALGF